MTIRDFISRTLMEPLRLFPTSVRRAVIELVSEYMETYHYNIENLTSLPMPSKDRMDVLDAIATSWGFSIDTDASINEQVALLAHAVETYKSRGSIFSIEHMYALYGGNLPKVAKVSIPSYGLFRYSISEYSVSDVYQDGTYNRPGVYDITIYQYTKDIQKLLEFLYDELVHAGTKVYLLNRLMQDSDISSFEGDNAFYICNSVYDTATYDISEYAMIDAEDIYRDTKYFLLSKGGVPVLMKRVDQYYYVSRGENDEVIIETSPESAEGIYVRSDLSGSQVPLVHYDSVSFVKGYDSTKDIISESLPSLSSLCIIATMEIGSVSRNTDMVDILEFVLKEMEEDV